MGNNNDIHVKIAEVKIGKNGDILKATLGSCVGIAFLWKAKAVFGLAHCLLPEANTPTTLIGAKYVSQAVPSLMAILKIKPENVKEIEVHIAGGGNMMPQLSRSNTDHIGIQNIAAAKKYLEMYGFKIRSADTGGEEGRQIILDCTTETVSVSKLLKAI